jgi:hypothetical protein
MVTAVGKTAGVENSAVGFDSGDWTSWVSAGITVADFIPLLMSLQMLLQLLGMQA